MPTARLPRERLWFVALLVVAMVPFAVAIVRMATVIGDRYSAPSDWALMELQLRDLAHRAIFVGPYSRFGWNHPGPLLYYVLAGPYYLLGRNSWAMPVGAALVNGVTVVGIAVVARRRAGFVFAVFAVVITLTLAHALGADFLRNPWNPYLPVLPLLLLVLLCWALACGELWAAPWAFGVASFAVQSHVGFTTVCLALLAVATVGVATWAWREHRHPETWPDRRRSLARAALLSTAVLLVLWALPLYGEFVDGNGNLREVLRWLGSKPAGPGYLTGLRVVGIEFGRAPEWISGARDPGFLGGGVVSEGLGTPVVLVAGIAATGVFVLRRAREELWFSALVAAGLVAGVFAVANVVGPLYPYLFRWTWAMGAALGLVVLWGAWLAIPPERRPTFHTAVAAGGSVVAVGLVVAMTVNAAGAGVPYERDQVAIASLIPSVLRAVPEDAPGAVFVDTAHAGLFGATVVLAFEKRGDTVLVDPSTRIYYGKQRADDGRPRKATVAVVSGDDAERKIPPDEGRLIAFYRRDLTGAERRGIEDVASRALTQLADEPDAEGAREAIRKWRRETLARPVLDVAVYLIHPAPAR